MTPAVKGCSTTEQQSIDKSIPDIANRRTKSPEPFKVLEQELKPSGVDLDIHKADTSCGSLSLTSKGRAIKLPERLKDFVRH